MDQLTDRLTPRQIHVANKKPRFHPLATKLTSTSWDGDSKTTGDNGILDLSAIFGLPGGITAVLMRASADFVTAGHFLRLGSNSSNQACLVLTCVDASINVDATVPIPCDANGDIYFHTNQTLTAIFLQVWGYWI